RNAKSPCINLLLTYDSGCIGSCAYCGLSKKRPGQYTKKSFIRVDWPIYSLSRIIEQIKKKNHRVKRICLSMITKRKAVRDSLLIIKRLKSELEIPLSLLATPTILKKQNLIGFKANGVEMFGIAVDTATKDLFEKHRGKKVKGPHRWRYYWQTIEEAVEVFGPGMVGVHLIVGLGETEEEMAKTIQRVHDLRASTHLFSFFPESDSLLAQHPQPPIGQYRRIQLARYLIDEGIAHAQNFHFDQKGKIVDFGIETGKLEEIINAGRPFMTSGCPDKNGEVACNRPYANSLPGPQIRNFPFLPEPEDIERIKSELT
ncbi:MAG TPA: radical SAM protein, partial [bacterium (Candidatus Stahlbacteria)]|nr:radical SAM protein [Candidatus Stahlbacteria bacterium]